MTHLIVESTLLLLHKVHMTCTISVRSTSTFENFDPHHVTYIPFVFVCSDIMYANEYDDRGLFTFTPTLNFFCSVYTDFDWVLHLV